MRHGSRRLVRAAVTFASRISTGSSWYRKAGPAAQPAKLTAKRHDSKNSAFKTQPQTSVAGVFATPPDHPVLPADRRGQRRRGRGIRRDTRGYPERVDALHQVDDAAVHQASIGVDHRRSCRSPQRSKRAAENDGGTGKNRLSESRQNRKTESEGIQSVSWSEREDLNLRPLVSQTSALTGLRHAPMPFH
jgi:hypothetical protein